MYKISLGVLCLVLAIIFGNAMIVTGSEDADKMCVPMGTILLEPLEGVEAKRPPVDFQHSTHFGSTCQTCHHKTRPYPFSSYRKIQGKYYPHGRGPREGVYDRMPGDRYCGQSGHIPRRRSFAPVQRCWAGS